MKKIFFPLILLIVFVSIAPAGSNDETLAIKKTAMNYMESWYQGDEKKMAESLHKDLAKRSLRLTNGKLKLRHTKSRDMKYWTGQGYGKTLWRDTYKIDVTILDHNKGIASVKVVTPDYWEYLHLVKIDGKWLIINALYENTE